MRPRTDHGRLAAASIAALATAWSLAACGIPTGAAPEVIEEAPTDFDQSSSTQVEEFLPHTRAETTVENFLKAATGDPDGRNDRLNAFTPKQDVQFSDPAGGIGLLADIQLTPDAEDTDYDTVTITATGSVIGIYMPDGSVRMSTNPRDYTEKFTLERESLQAVWMITDLPTQVMLDYNQFVKAYEQAPLYFQAEEDQLLVPDLRWIFGQLDEATEQRLRMRWLLDGPSDFVEQSARNAIPTGTTEQMSEEDGLVHIDLALGEAPDADTDAIAAEIAWSLGIEGEFELTVDGEAAAGGNLGTWRQWNAIPVDLAQIAYYISDETVWKFENDQVTDTDTDPDRPWVGFSLGGLQQVGIGPANQIAAIVAGPDGEVLETGTSERNMSTVAGISGDLSDPQWLDDGTVIVIDDGVPTAVDPGTDAVQTLVGENVTALALAPDGRRLAYVEDGVARVVPLKLDADGNIQVGEPRRIGLGITDVTDVAWSSEDYLWVVGRQGDDQLFRVAIDNSRTEVQEGTSGFPQVQQIAANPADPVEANQNRGEPVIVVSASRLYRVHTTELAVVDYNGQAIDGSVPFTVLQ